MPNAPKGTGGYQVWEPDHWVFDSVEATIGSDLGAEDVTVAYDATRRPIEIIDGVPKTYKIKGPRRVSEFPPRRQLIYGRSRSAHNA